MYQRFKQGHKQSVEKLYKKKNRDAREWASTNTMTAWQGDQLQAIIYWWRSLYHTKALYIELTSRTKDTALLTGLLQSVQQEHPLQCLVSEEDTCAMALLSQLGFQKVRTTHMPTLSLKKESKYQLTDANIYSLSQLVEKEDWNGNTKLDKFLEGYLVLNRTVISKCTV
ncbi:hypothetical protein NSQ26_06355 [Bacillus sp. FSL W7-1360]